MLSMTLETSLPHSEFEVNRKTKATTNMIIEV